MSSLSEDTIAAIATPQGRGGVGIVRVSGKKSKSIAELILSFVPKARYAHHSTFKGKDNVILDEGISLFFSGPNSFTGEDVLELQGHGGPVILHQLLTRVIELGARLAKPGEFSERAFLNGKLDLAQAEAVADLIDATTNEAATAAVRSLQGDFSAAIKTLLAELINLRMFVESALDFPEEEIDFMTSGGVISKLENVIETLQSVFQAASHGQLLRDGMHVVIVGLPNAGKSSLLNRLSGMESAIVTPIAGTTRDVLRIPIHLDGMPLHIIDTAGLRNSEDTIEQEGIRRTLVEVEQADHVLVVIDNQELKHHSLAETFTNILQHHHLSSLLQNKKLTLILNKSDLYQSQGVLEEFNAHKVINLSAKTGNGINHLKDHLKNIMGFSANVEGTFMARRRHLDALKRAQEFCKKGLSQLVIHKASELLAEDLRQAQLALSEITGEFTSDDLLGEIFSRFCIGK